MAETQPKPEQTSHESTVRHEHSDAKFSWVLGLVITTAILGILMHVVIWEFFVHERDRLNEDRASKYPLAPRPSTALPPEPRLEQLDRLSGNDLANVYVREK